LVNTIKRAKAQLNGTLIDPGTGLPWVNNATPGPNPDGSYNIDVVNFEQSGATAGYFTGDTAFPGLPAADDDSIATETTALLDLAAGYYRLGVRSDDGFIVEIGTPPAGLFTAVAVGSYDGGRGSSESVFDFYAPVAGIYCTRLIYFEGGGGAD